LLQGSWLGYSLADVIALAVVGYSLADVITFAVFAVVGYSLADVITFAVFAVFGILFGPLLQGNSDHIQLYFIGVRFLFLARPVGLLRLRPALEYGLGSAAELVSNAGPCRWSLIYNSLSFGITFRVHVTLGLWPIEVGIYCGTVANAQYLTVFSWLT
jgi:hypothetical protein